VNLKERRLRIRASTSKSVHARECTIPVETAKALDNYVADREGETDDDAPFFTDRHGEAMTGNGVRKLFERLAVRSAIPDLCAHMLRHTWATIFHRSASGSRMDLMTEGGWTTGRMVERYTKGTANRGTTTRTVAIHGTAQRTKRETARREVALTAEKRPE
jgi:integrase